MEFQPKMNNWNYCHSTWFLDYTSVLANSVVLQGLPNAPRNLFPNHQHIFKQLWKPGFRINATIATQGMVWIISSPWYCWQMSLSEQSLTDDSIYSFWLPPKVSSNSSYIVSFQIVIHYISYPLKYLLHCTSAKYHGVRINSK